MAKNIASLQEHSGLQVFKGRCDWIDLLQTCDTKHFSFPIRVLVIQVWPELMAMCGLGKQCLWQESRQGTWTEAHEMELGKDRWTQSPETSVNTPPNESRKKAT